MARQPQDHEQKALADLLTESRDWYRDHPDRARQLVADEPALVSVDENAAWIATARILLNLDEFITRD